MKKNCLIILFSILSFSVFSQSFTGKKTTRKSIENCELLINNIKLQDISQEGAKKQIADYKKCKETLNHLSNENRIKYYKNLSYLNLAAKDYQKVLSINDHLLNKLELVKEDSLTILHRSLSIYELFGNEKQYLSTAKEIQNIVGENDDVEYWTYGFYRSKSYYKAQQYKKAIQAWQKDRQDLSFVDDKKPFMISKLNDLGYYYLMNNQIDSAQVIFDRAKKYVTESTFFANEQEKKYYLGVINGNNAEIYIKNKEYEKAIELLKADISSTEQTKDINNLVSGYIKLADVYIKNNQIDKASQVINSIKAIPEEKIDPALVYLKSNLLADYYAASNQYKKSNEALRKSIELKREAYKKQKELELSGVEVQLIRDTQQKEIELNKIELEKTKEKKRDVTIVNGLIISLLIGFLGFIFSNNKKNKIVRKNLSKIEAQNQIINKAYKRNAFLLKELNHRVKNNLQVISGILSIEEKMTESEDIRAITKKTRNRINSIALIHQQFIEQEFEQAVDVKSYFETIIHSTIESFGLMNKVEVDTNIKVGNIPLDTISPLGLILNELVTNSCKHAFPYTENPKLNLEFIDVQKQFFFSYKDNGPGLKESAKPNSIGMQLLPGLSRQINGDIKMENDNGLLCTIKIKK